MKKFGSMWGFVLAWIFLTILLVFYLQARDFYGSNPIVRRRQEVIEAFQEMSDPDRDAGGDPGLGQLRKPYNLLDWISAAEKPLYPTAKGCREADFQIRLERTGNFRQMTNNYKRGDPDSCSTPLHDLTLAFYKPEPVPQYGCIQPYVE